MRCACVLAFPTAAVVALCITTSTLGAAQQPRDQPAAVSAGTGTLTGRVTVATERELPVRRARVILESASLPQPQVGDTDADGRFRFERLPAGAYRLRAEKPGFVTMSFGARHARDRGQPVDIVPGRTSTANITLPRGSALEGRIVNAEGDPVQNLVVSAVRLTFGPYGRQPFTIRDARTDDLGRYRIHSLPAGDYYVHAAPDPTDALVERQVPGPRPPGLARTFYPGTPNASEAQRITLAVGGEAGGLDFTPAAVPLARLTLRVEDSAGKGPRTPGVRLQRVGAPPDEVRGTMLPSNQAMFPAVPPGEYWVMAAAIPAGGGDPEFAVARHTIAGADLSLTMRTESAGSVAGHVVTDEGPLPDLLRVRLRANTVDYELPNPSGAGAAAPAPPPIAAGGSFVLKGLPGRRVVRLDGLPAGWALSSVRLGEADISDIPSEIRPAEPAAPLVVTVTSRTGVVAGMVTAGGGKRPVPNARVVLFTPDERQWDFRSRYIRTALAGADGAYVLEGLLPAVYLACALDWLDEGSWFDPDILRRLSTTASRVSVEASGRQTLGLVLGELR